MKRMDAREQETAAGMNCLTLQEEEVPRSSEEDAAKRPLSRLQKRAPASLQLKSLRDSFLAQSDNNNNKNRSPIPLLSPLVTSPLSERYELEDKEEEKSNREPYAGNLPVNGWKHPAAPFFCDKASSFNLLPIKLF